MRTMLKQFGAAMLLGLLAISPVPAQPAAALEAATNKPEVSAAAPKLDRDLEKMRIDNDKEIERARLDNAKEIERTKLDNEKDLERTKLDNDKQIVINRTDSRKMMVHDLAWNSWVLFAISIFLFSYLRDKRRHDTIRLMIEKGTPITPELLDGLRKKSRLGARSYDPHGYLCWGITEVLVAIALMICFNWGAGRAAGWIVLSVGVANLILWSIDWAFSKKDQSK